MSRYWKEVATRAWRDSLSVMGWGTPPQFMVRVGGFVLVLVVFGFAGAWERVFTETADSIVIVGVSLTMFALMFVYFFIATPAKLDQERREIIDTLETALSPNEQSALELFHKEGQFPYTPTVLDHPLCISVKNSHPSEIIRNVEVHITGDFPRGEMPLPLRHFESLDTKVDLSSGMTAFFEVAGVNKYRKLIICGVNHQTHHLGTYKIKLKVYGEGTGSTNRLFILEATEDGAKLLPQSVIEGVI